ncbi:MAG: sugar phosphate isomerase/epimerase [Planctomycetota bacterium]|nr:sugar phosphate isomerase/epimerase [Planctomycetota bacterium]
MPIQLATSACCLPTLSRDELLEASARAGYTGVELFCTWTSAKAEVAGEPANAFLGHGVRVSALHLPGKVEEGLKAVDLAASAGVPQVVAHGAGKPEDAGTWLAPVVRHARTKGVEVVVTNHKGQSIETAEQVEAVLEACGDARPWVLLEAGQYWAAGLDAFAALERFRDLVRLVHIKDLDEQGRSVPFGTGVSPWREFMRALDAAGYAGRVVVELELKGTPPEEVERLLADARQKLEAVLEACAQR